MSLMSIYGKNHHNTVISPQLNIYIHTHTHTHTHTYIAIFRLRVSYLDFVKVIQI